MLNLLHWLANASGLALIDQELLLSGGFERGCSMVPG